MSSPDEFEDLPRAEIAKRPRVVRGAGIIVSDASHFGRALCLTPRPAWSVTFTRGGVLSEHADYSRGDELFYADMIDNQATVIADTIDAFRS